MVSARTSENRVEKMTAQKITIRLILAPGKRHAQGRRLFPTLAEIASRRDIAGGAAVAGAVTAAVLAGGHADAGLEDRAHVFRMLEADLFGDGADRQICFAQQILRLAKLDADDFLMHRSAKHRAKAALEDAA